MRSCNVYLAKVCLGSALALGAASLPAADAMATAPAAQKTSSNSVMSLETLLRSFAAMPGLSAEFREEKRMALLAEPLTNEGTLHFHQGQLARHTLRPLRSSVIIGPERLEFGTSDGHESMDLRRNPVVKLFVESFVKVLAGDQESLEKIYRIEFKPGEGGQWELTLRPRISPMDKVIDFLRLQGEGLAMRTMSVREKNGDETVTTFSKVDTRKRYSAREMRTVFSLH